MCIIWVGKIVLIILFLLIGCVSFIGTFVSWRDVHNRPANYEDKIYNGKFSEKWIDKNDEKVMFITPWHGLYFADTANETKTLFAACDEDFEEGDDFVRMPKESGFYGDYVLISLLLIAFFVCCFNIIWTIISFFACCCDTCFLNLLPGTTFFVTVLLITSTIIFAIDVDEYYGKIPIGEAEAELLIPLGINNFYKGAMKGGIQTDGKCTYLNFDGQFPAYISYGAGFYLTIVCIILNVGAFILSLFVSFLRKIFCA